MKIDRLIGIIMLLQQNGRLAMPELAARFEVSKRTIGRDIEDICKAGIPLVTVQGCGGGVSIADGYKIDKAILTNGEIEAIFAGLSGIDSVSQKPLGGSVGDKLRGAQRRESVFIDLSGFNQHNLTAKIEILKEAISAHEIVEFVYYSRKGETTRRIEPYNLVFKWSSWYVYGYCCDRKDYRLFKINRLWSLDNTHTCFKPRDIPDCNKNIESYFSSEPLRLEALFDGSVKYRLIDEYGTDCYTSSDNGELLFKRDFADYEYLLNWVLSFGDRVRVIKPAELAEEIVCQAENLLKRYKHDI